MVVVVIVVAAIVMLVVVYAVLVVVLVVGGPHSVGCYWCNGAEASGCNDVGGCWWIGANAWLYSLYL